MTANRREVDLALRVRTEGAEKVGDLAGDLRDVAGAGSRAAPGLQASAEALEKLSANARELRAAEAAANAEAARTKRTRDEQREALERLRLNYRIAGGDAAAFRVEEARLQLALLDANRALREKQTELKGASNAARGAAAAEREMAEEMRRVSATSKQAAADVAKVGSNAGEAAGVIRQLAPLLAGAFSGQQFVQILAQSESLKRSFEQVFGSTQRARTELEFVQQTANRLGLEAQSLSQSYLSLSAATKGTAIEGAQTRAVFEAIVRSMAALGKSTPEVERALTAVAQISSKGVASMEELRGQLGEALPGAMQAAAAGAGLTVAQLTEMVSTGKVLASDLLPALTKGLNDLYANGAPPDNIVSNWARLKNAITETITAVGEGGASQGLAKALSGAALAVQGAAAEVDILGTSLGEMAAAVVTGNYELGTGEALSARYAEQLRKTAETAGLAEKAEASLTAARQQGTKSAQEAFVAAERLAQKQGESMLKVKSDYAELAKSSAQYTEQLEKEQKARTAEGEALVKLVALYGTEAERRQVLAQVTQTQYVAAYRLAAAQELEAVTAQSFLTRLKEEALRRGDNTEATRKEIEAAEKVAKAKNAESEQSRAIAGSKRTEAEAAKVAAEAYKDNANRVYELRGAAEAARAELARLVELEKQGKATADQVAEARNRAAGATALYRDALADATAQAERRIAVEEQQARAAQGATSVEMERARAAREVAAANGDAAAVGKLARQEAMLQVQTHQQEADAARRVADAIREAANRKEEELRATGQLTAAKQAELDASRRSADLKEQEAEKADILADKVRKLTDSEQARTAALEQQISMQEKALELAQRQAALEERKRNPTNTAGDVVNMGGQTLMSLIQQLKSWGVDDKRAEEIARQFTDEKGDVPYFNNPGQKRYQSDTLSMALQKAASQALYGGGPQTSQLAAPVRTVNIRLGGRETPVNVASEDDSNALVGVLRQLESASSRAKKGA